MKIHIVKKGDTLWEIAKENNVDFEQLKSLNPQLSSPDMIMPGMKIKIPSDAKPVKKESMKEKEEVKTPYKDMSPKPLPVIKEDEKEKPKMQQKPPMHQMPIPTPVPIPKPTQMPMMDHEMNQYTTINFSQMPPKPVQKEVKYHEVKHHEKMHPMPQPQYMPMVPMCCYPMYPYNHQMHHGNVSPMHMGPPPQHPMPYKKQGCGCEGEKPPFQHYAKNMNMYEEMPEMEMPKKPKHKYEKDCDDMNKHHHYGMSNQGYPQMDMNKGYGNPYPTPPGFQPFPTKPFRDDEDENNNE